MTEEEYLASPTRASSLSFRKSRTLVLPDEIRTVPDEVYRAEDFRGWTDEVYFRLVHRMKDPEIPAVPPGFSLRSLPREAFARHIELCYGMEDASPELAGLSVPPLFDPSLWIAFCPAGSTEPAATGIAVFEATHGTAPKYAGMNKVNPGSLILSGEMMLRHLGWNEAADLIIKAMDDVIASKTVTYDFARLMEGAREVSCSAFGDALAEAMG